MNQRITTLEREGCGHLWEELPNLLFEACSKELECKLVESELTDEEHQEADVQAKKLTSEQFLDRNSDRVDSLSNWHFKVTGSTQIFQVTAVDQDRTCEVVVQVSDGLIECRTIIDSAQASPQSTLNSDFELPNLDSLMVGEKWQFS